MGDNNAPTNRQDEYGIGDTITYATFGGTHRTGQVIFKSNDIKAGAPGFDLELQDGEQVWGYDRQIVTIERADSYEDHGTTPEDAGYLENAEYLAAREAEVATPPAPKPEGSRSLMATQMTQALMSLEQAHTCLQAARSVTLDITWDNTLLHFLGDLETILAGDGEGTDSGLRDMVKRAMQEALDAATNNRPVSEGRGGMIRGGR